MENKVYSPKENLTLEVKGKLKIKIVNVNFEMLLENNMRLEDKFINEVLEKVVVNECLHETETPSE